VGAAGAGVLVDAGLPGRVVERRLRGAGFEPGAVRAVVVTHEHRDHLAGVGVWCRRYGVPAYLTEACLQASQAVLGPAWLRGVDVRLFEAGRPFEAAGLGIHPFPTCHDAADPVGLRVTDGQAWAGIATDLGFASGPVREALGGVDILLLESNHDEDRLWAGPYPWPLKQRIRSRHGHLSNRACAELVAELLHPGLRAVVLGHLSEANNEPALAYAATRQVLEDAGAAGEVALLVARQDRPGRVVGR